jgi:hypothetical protein
LSEVGSAFGWLEAIEQRSNSFPNAFDGTLLSLSEQRFKLGKDLFDRVQIGAVGRQKDQPCAGGAYGIADCAVFVRAKIIHDHNIAGLEGGGEDLLNIGKEGLAVDWPIQHKGRGDPVTAQRGNKRHRLPVAVRDLGNKPLAAKAPAARAGHVGFGPGFINEDEPRRIDPGLVFLPAEAPPGNVRTILLCGKQGFF